MKLFNIALALPPTFIDGRLEEPGVLQISATEYASGEKPNADFKDLIKMSGNVGLRHSFGTILNRTSGRCKIGRYGMVEFSGNNFPYISVWCLSNGKDFVFSTFICSRKPEPSEINDVKEILFALKKKLSLF